MVGNLLISTATISFSGGGLFHGDVFLLEDKLFHIKKNVFVASFIVLNY
jgi:hypothetical protein